MLINFQYIGARKVPIRSRSSPIAAVRAPLRGKMARRNISHLQVIERLQSIGLNEDERNLRIGPAVEYSLTPSCCDV